MAGIKDIARAANVSLSTVSKAIHGRHDIGEATRARILKIAEDLDYHPKAFGQGSKKVLTENVGVIMRRELQAHNGNPFFSRVLEGIEAELAVNNFSLLIHLLPKFHDGRFPKMLKERTVDGVVLVGPMDRSFVEDITRTGLPTAVIEPKSLAEDVSQVLIDNEEGAFLATQHLIDQGHRKIGFISDQLNRHSFTQRYAGYTRAMKVNDLRLNKSYVRTAGHEQGAKHVNALLDGATSPTAILFANDLNALSGCRAIKARGLSIPDDISVVGFDDIFLASQSSPPLTTVRVYKEEMGSIAVRHILNTLDEKKKGATTTIVPVKLIERGSVGPVSS